METCKLLADTAILSQARNILCEVDALGNAGAFRGLGANATNGQKLEFARTNGLLSVQAELDIVIVVGDGEPQLLWRKLRHLR